MTPTAAAAAEIAPGRVVVGFTPGADAGERAEIRKQADATLLGTVSGPREQVLKIDGDPEVVSAQLERRAEVEYAEPDSIVRASWTPNDSLLGAQWWLGQTSTPRAWDAARGAGALVGVVDTGVTFAHPDLGRVAPRGYDFVNRDSDPTDDQGHGTSVTGVIAATAGNGAGIAGVAPESTVVEAKALDAKGFGFSSDVADAMGYAVDQGARVVNLSLGGPRRSQAIASAITTHPATLFVVAAGNENADNDSSPGTGTWPCNEPAANVICVGASTRSEVRASFSNWGRASVDLMAPGESIMTTTRDSRYASVDGTSFSAPMVAGAAALLYGLRPRATVADVRDALLSSTDAVAAYGCLTVTGGRLNVDRAVQTIASASPPAAVATSTCDPTMTQAPTPAAPPAVAPVTPAVTPPAVVLPAVPLPRTTPGPKSCTVPKLKRLTSAQAKRRLKTAGCRVGTVRRRSSTAVRAGRVVTSAPRAGTRSRAVVGITVSRGARR